VSRTVYVNGQYLPEKDAKISIFDRGFLMADGIYEVTSVLGGKLIDFDGHFMRLGRSLNELDMPSPISKETLLAIHRKLIKYNDVDEGMIYMQITRGAPDDRDFVFPDPEITPQTIVLFTQNKPGLADSLAAKKGLKVISIEDMRWGRRDKNCSIALSINGQNDGEKSRCR
jgi:D-alanine transaminase